MDFIIWSSLKFERNIFFKASVAELNNLGETIASLSISDNNPLEAAVAEGVKQQSPNATLEFGETAIGNNKKNLKKPL